MFNKILKEFVFARNHLNILIQSTVDQIIKDTGSLDEAKKVIKGFRWYVNNENGSALIELLSSEIKKREANQKVGK